MAGLSTGRDGFSLSCSTTGFNIGSGFGLGITGGGLERLGGSTTKKNKMNCI